MLILLLLLLLLLFSYPMFAVILLLFCAHCLYARALPFTHTLTRSLSDDPGFARPGIGRFVSIVQVFDETVRFASSWSFSLIDSGILIFLVFILFLDSRFISDSIVIPVLCSYDIMRGYLYVLL